MTEAEQLADAREWLQFIADIALDRDGWKSAKDLGELVDELRGYALNALHGVKPWRPEVSK